ncbi:MAG: hypothetical protein E7260_10010 [Lachnospiraceae bacterium]|nr:hypothetical protein [Lachnospiraceae bacterium]
MKQKKTNKIVIILLTVAMIAVVALIGAELAKRGERPAGNQGTPTATQTPTKVPTDVPTTAPTEAVAPTEGASSITVVPTAAPTLTPTPETEDVIPLVELTPQDLKEGTNIFIYCKGANAVLASPSENNRINPAKTTLEHGVLSTGNGARIFTVEQNGEYVRFYNEIDGYLCANGTGNNAFYSKTAGNEADWKIEQGNGGYYLQNRVAKYRDIYPQYLEYYSGLITTYSMNNPKDYNIYTFHFYSAGELTGAVNKPMISVGRLAVAEKGITYDFKFQIEATYDIAELTVTLNGADLRYGLEDGICYVQIPAELVGGGQMAVQISGKDTEDVAFRGEIVITVNDIPVFANQTPGKTEQTGMQKRPVISVDVVNAGNNPTVAMTVGGKQVTAEYKNGKITYTPDAALADGRVEVVVELTRAEDNVSAKTSWKFTVGEPSYNLYFGQMHSHTEYSDGSGSLTSALDYIYNLPESANVDYVAFTDHSNYFDKNGGTNPEGALYDLSLATDTSRDIWLEYTETIDAFNAKQNKVLAIGGFEMTWSSGPGHMNTFNTEGIVSRNNQVLNNKTNFAGMQAYYELLSEDAGEGSISQFNHPGGYFGDFAAFGYWDKEIDDRIQLIEVSNGSGQVGASGYYPSYESYNLALDKGWHLAPMMNQDNHGGRWGNSNEARGVILAEDLTEENIYDAIYNRRAYATEDRNLEILYTVNGRWLGSIFTEKPEELKVRVQFNDPDSVDRITKVEVIVDSGRVAYEWTDAADLADGLVETSLAPNYRYYYIRITQADGNLAFTAPVWVETK